MLYSRSLLVICFIYSSVYMSIPTSQFMSPSISPITISLFSTFVALFLTWCFFERTQALQPDRLGIGLFGHFPVVFQTFLLSKLPFPLMWTNDSNSSYCEKQVVSYIKCLILSLVDDTHSQMVTGLKDGLIQVEPQLSHLPTRWLWEN